MEQITRARTLLVVILAGANRDEDTKYLRQAVNLGLVEMVQLSGEAEDRLLQEGRPGGQIDLPLEQEEEGEGVWEGQRGREDELALALSLSQEQERERQEQAAREEELVRHVMELSLRENAEAIEISQQGEERIEDETVEEVEGKMKKISCMPGCCTS